MTLVWKEILVNLAGFLPFFAIVWLLNLSEGKRSPENPDGGMGLGILSFVLIGILFAGVLLIGVMLQIMGDRVADTLSATVGENPAKLANQLKWTGLGLWLPSLTALLALIPAVRRLFGKVMPINPENRLHTASLSMSMLVFIQIGMTLAIGLETLSETAVRSSLPDTLASLWSQDLLLVLLSFIGVGWLTRRNGREALRRLGLTRPAPGALIKGVGIGLALMAAAVLLEQLATSQKWLHDPHVDEFTEKLIGPLFESAFGILTLGLAAALGEETLFRGALQPRLGLVYTTILFTLTHANYGLSIATLVVFAVGLVLGWIRMRHNTVVCMVVHATYNIGLGVLSRFMS